MQPFKPISRTTPVVSVRRSRAHLRRRTLSVRGCIKLRCASLHPWLHTTIIKLQLYLVFVLIVDVTYRSSTYPLACSSLTRVHHQPYAVLHAYDTHKAIRILLWILSRKVSFSKDIRSCTVTCEFMFAPVRDRSRCTVRIRGESR